MAKLLKAVAVGCLTVIFLAGGYVMYRFAALVDSAALGSCRPDAVYVAGVLLWGAVVTAACSGMAAGYLAVKRARSNNGHK